MWVLRWHDAKTMADGHLWSNCSIMSLETPLGIQCDNTWIAVRGKYPPTAKSRE